MRWPNAPKKGDPIRAEWGAAIVEILAQIVRPKHPLKFQRGRNQVVLTLDDTALPSVLLGKSPGSAIAAGATGTVTLYKEGTYDTLSSRTITARNPWPESCPPGRKVAIGTLNGVPDCILWWSCNIA